MDKESLKQATTFFDFINVELYDNIDRYSVKDMKYWIYSELKDELQEHRTSEHLRYDMIEKYIEKGLVYVKG